jgi:hypothetical protein
MTPTELRKTLDRLGLSQVGAARLFNYSDGRAIRSYLSGRRKICPRFALLLRLYLAGKITSDDISRASAP